MPSPSIPQIFINEGSTNRAQTTSASTVININPPRAVPAFNRRGSTRPEGENTIIPQGNSNNFKKKLLKAATLVFICSNLPFMLLFFHTIYIIFFEKSIKQVPSQIKENNHYITLSGVIGTVTATLDILFLILLYKHCLPEQHEIEDPPPSYKNYTKFPLVQQVSITPLSASNHSINTLPNYEKAISRFPAVKEAALQNRGLNPSSSGSLPDTSSVSIEMQPLTLEPPNPTI